MGRLPEAGSGKSGFNLAIISIVALHVVFFGGLLLQGCTKPKATDTTDTGLGQPSGLSQAPVTNPAPADPFAGYNQPYGAATNLAGYQAPAAPNLTFTNPPAIPTNAWVSGTPAQEPAGTDLVAAPAAATSEYKIAKGDTPAGIARKNGITVEQLREANPGLDDRRLQIGQKLQIPAAPRKEVASATPGTPGAGAAPAAQVHVVKAGENLNRIAAKYGTTVKELRAFNSLKTDRIVVNQKLKIPPAKAKVEAAPAPVPAPGA
jgi:LysM repeat protein